MQKDDIINKIVFEVSKQYSGSENIVKNILIRELYQYDLVQKETAIVEYNGGMVIAAAQVLQEKGINYQRVLDVVCQDLDWTAVYMCYVQLSLLGVKAIVAQGEHIIRTVYSKPFERKGVLHACEAWTFDINEKEK